MLHYFAFFIVLHYCTADGRLLLCY